MMAAYSLRREAEIDHERRRHGAGERVGELEQHHEDEHDDRHVAGEEIGEGAVGGRRTRARSGFSRACAACSAAAAADFSGSVAMSVVAMPIDHERGHGEIAGGPGAPLAEAEALEAAHQEQRARGRDQHADAVGRHVGRPCRRPARSRRRLSTRKASMTMSCVAEAVATRAARRTPPSQGAATGSQKARNAIAAISRSCENTSQPRRRPSSRDSTGTSSASTIGAHRNLMV